jgi:ATP-dependent Lhr-like helicase
MRRQAYDGELICLSATDPANLLGSVVVGPKLPRVAGSLVLWRDGLAVATSVAGQVEMLVPMSAAEKTQATRVLSLNPTLRFMQHDVGALSDLADTLHRSDR